jgi:hypothetical protein
MASFTRVHGDARPVVNLDSKEGFKNNDIPSTFSDSSGIAINLAGPKLDLFSIRLDNNTSPVDPVDQMGTGGAIEAVLNLIQQLATVHMYQVDDDYDNTRSQLSVAIYPTGAWTRSDLEDAIQTLGTVNGYDMSSADVESSRNFKLDFFC